MYGLQYKSRRQSGFTLVEVLVASAIFTIIVIAALLIYDRSNQVFKSSSEAVDLQQNTRVAFNKLVADMRMTGFDYDRDGIPTGVSPTTWETGVVYAVGDIVVPTVSNGNMYFCTGGGTSGGTEPTWPNSGTVNDNGITWQQSGGVAVYQQPDEQIEYAGQTALTIRGNFDYDTNEAEDRLNGRETSLEASTPQFPVITTGNDEIVTYALSKPSIVAAAVSSTAASGCTATSTNCIHFFADVNASGAEARTAYPGGNKERAVDIKGVDLTNSSPPYTLYRISLAKDGHAVFTPVADNIRSLKFTYYEDTAGATKLTDLATTPADVSNGIGGEGQFDPNDSGAVIPDRLIRSKIKSVQLQLTGMNPLVDPKYNDPNPAWDAVTDTVSPHTRKVTLSTLIVPRNLGKRGQRLQATQAPQAPAITKVCIGYCGLAQITWSSPSGGGVTGYNILYDTSESGSFQSLQSQGLVTTGYVTGLTPDVPYYFRVQALNDYGSGTSSTFAVSGTAVPFTLKSATTPNAPSVPAATTTLKNEIDVTWNKPTDYSNSANTITCTPGGAQSPAPPIPGAESITYNVWRGSTSTVNTAGPAYIAYTATGTGIPSTNVATGQVTLKDTNVANCVPYYYAVQAVKPSCETSSAYYTQPAHSTAVTGVSGGQSASTGYGPDAPSDLTILSSSSCAAGTCNVGLEWPRVSRDTAPTPGPNPIIVDSYEISRTQKLNGVVTTVGSSPTTTIGSNASFAGTVTRTISGFSLNAATLASASETIPETDNITGKDYVYEYKVRANQCTLPGAYGPVRIFPCTFLANPVSVTVDPNFQGTGTPVSPYYFDTPATITASSTVAVSAIHAIVYAWSGSAWASPVDLGTRTGPITSTTFSFTGASFGTLYLFDVSFTDTGGCTTHGNAQGFMESTNCCLRQLADDPLQTSSSATRGVIRGFTAGTSSAVDVFSENVCSSVLPIQASGITFTWDDINLSTPKPKVSSLEFPTTATSGSNVANCTWDATIKCYTYAFGGSGSDKGTYTVPTITSTGGLKPLDIPASATTYRMRVKFTKTLDSQPITNFSIKYLRSGDVSTTTCPTIP